MLPSPYTIILPCLETPRRQSNGNPENQRPGVLGCVRYEHFCTALLHCNSTLHGTNDAVSKTMEPQAANGPYSDSVSVVAPTCHLDCCLSLTVQLGSPGIVHSVHSTHPIYKPTRT
ncbi:hypothetical protein CORC01_13894 [Colletotrichum orchidophilum]|uniref:Uncharacterized protein n=1 Tax=Colletotrichum orchidophilum TaxID=1209926 RepID=A0A1G4ANQ5_9PEZI|nr:uncharacterized protein CORC01_13894 [Colletotrichum orchidophilum]OHE90820.1 hypothetical protein CORC01_13894 [Colletotrichum orchidophilum]